MRTLRETPEQELEEWYALIAKHKINTNQTEERVASTVMCHREGDSSAEDLHLLTRQQWGYSCSCML